MEEYVDNIILPYVEKVREKVGAEKAALVIMDNFKGQTTTKITNRLEENNILISWLPPNMTDRLQPMDISVNKPAKEYLKKEFEDWYSEQVMQQLDGKDMDDLESTKIQPINLGMPILKEVSAKWLVGMVEYITSNPQFIVNGFICCGISSAIDGVVDMGSASEDSGTEEDLDSDFDDETEL